MLAAQAGTSPVQTGFPRSSPSGRSIPAAPTGAGAARPLPRQIAHSWHHWAGAAQISSKKLAPPRRAAASAFLFGRALPGAGAAFSIGDQPQREAISPSTSTARDVGTSQVDTLPVLDRQHYLGPEFKDLHRITSSSTSCCVSDVFKDADIHSLDEMAGRSLSRVLRR